MSGTVPSREALRSKIDAAIFSKSLARIFRSELEEGSVDGYPIACGDDFLVLQVLDDGIRYDGYSCIRLSDITLFEAPSPHHIFYERVLRLRHSLRPKFDDLKSTTVSSLLKFGQDKYNIVSVEERDADIAYIGKVVHIDRKGTFFRMVLISPDAEWYDDPDEFNFEDVGKISFGGAYEDALFLVASR